jgi:putative Holliday junction resolvase
MSTEPGTVLALDVGDARIGVARGEMGGRLAFGRGALERRGTRHDVEAVRRLAAAEGASLVVVGLPRRTQGDDSPQTRRVRAFADALREAGLEVVLEDERFTTQLADRRLRDAPLTKGRRRDKGRVDEASAVAILESYLARRAAPAQEGGA